MAIRKIKEAVRAGRSTFVTLECGHQRSFGSHTYNGKIVTPAELIGQSYDCKEAMCYNIKS